MLRVIFLFVLFVSQAACSGGASPAAPTSPTPAPTTTTSPPVAPTGPPTITITPTGMTPLELTINVGQRVTFVNTDIRAHDVVGGRDPNNPECPEIVQAGFLSPGQRGDTGIFTIARACEYHDHTMLGVPAFQGRIIIR